MKELNDMTLEELWQLFPIILKAHDPNYFTWYIEEKEHLLYILQNCAVKRIHHIGSTSVAGLLAKPIIDILLELPQSYDTTVVLELLQADNWILMQKNDSEQTLDFNKGYTPSGFAQKVYHLHVKPLGDWDELYFRDYLREHSDAARQYEALKQSLFQQYEFNRDAYTYAKSAFVQQYTQKAREKYAGRYLPYRSDV